VRDDGAFELLAGALREVIRDEPDPAAEREAALILSRLARVAATETRSEARALIAEGEQAQVRHKRVRQASESVLGRRAET